MFLLYFVFQRITLSVLFCSKVQLTEERLGAGAISECASFLLQKASERRRALFHSEQPSVDRDSAVCVKIDPMLQV